MKKNHRFTRFLLFIIFLLCCVFIMLSTYHLSSEDGVQSDTRSEIVTETIKEEVNSKLNERGIQLKDKIKYYVILHSPYGSNWNANMRKLAHFSIYFALACMLYISFAILGLKAGWRILFVMLLCFLFAAGDEYHQSFTAGRGASMSDVLLDSFGSLCATMMMSILALCIGGIKKVVEHIYR